MVPADARAWAIGAMITAPGAGAVVTAGEGLEFNNHAPHRFNELIIRRRNGILSPGKHGIWPGHLQDSQSISDHNTEV
jgi:hypothetical protein